MTKVIRAGLVLAVAVSAACGGGASGSTRERCENAYDDGAGNASTSERESWVDDCVAESP